MTDENDYICDRHGFVNAIRTVDGAVLAGDGIGGEPRILRMEPDYAAYRALMYQFI